MARLGGMARREAYWRELEKPENKNASPTKAAKLMGAKDRIPADCLDLGTLALDAFVDPSTVARVYSGRPGCACGCRGTYSTNPAQITRVCNALNSGAPDPNSYHESNADYVAKQIGGRAYTAYLKSGTLAKDSASWKGPVQGHSKGVVTYILSGNGNDNCGGKVNDYTALPSEWENGKKFETEEPRSYGGTSRWFNSLDAAKRAVEQAVEKDQAYWAKKGAKDRVPQDCLDLGALAL